MVLQGADEGASPPFDAPLYGASYTPSTPASEYSAEYKDCEAVAVVYSVEGGVTSILPEDVEPYGDPATAAVLVANYPYSTVGSYDEVVVMVQVEDLDGEMAYYVPYIYVTGDAGMASGREMAGAPKKLAEIDLRRTGNLVVGTLDRPAEKRLLTATVKPEKRVGSAVLESFMPSPTPLLSLRHLPPIEGGDGVTQLVKWYAEFEFEEDEDGLEMWSGDASVSFDSPSPHDPVHRVSPREILLGGYSRFDMELGTTEVQKRWQH